MGVAVQHGATPDGVGARAEGEMVVEGQEVWVVVEEGQAVVEWVVEGHVEGEKESIGEGEGVDEGMGEGEVMQAVTTTLPLPPEL